MRERISIVSSVAAHIPSSEKAAGRSHCMGPLGRIDSLGPGEACVVPAGVPRAFHDASDDLQLLITTLPDA